MRFSLILSLLLIGGREGTSATLYRIAAGSQGGIDLSGNTWQADAMYTGGARWTPANQPALSSQPIPFQSERYGAAFSYTLPVAAGDYTVTLKYLEVRTAASVPPIAVGQRVFSVSVNGAVMQPAMDVFALAGSLIPYSVTYPVTTTGPITVTLTSIVGNAVLSGIQVDGVASPPPLPFAPYFIGLESAPLACPSGLAFLVATDTNHLLWCVGGSPWHPIGDFNVGPSIFHLQAVDECHKTVTDPPNYTDCTGMYRAMLKRDDGTYISLVGIHLDLSSSSYPVEWLPAK